MPLADPQQLRCLYAAQSPAPIPLRYLQIPCHPYLGSHPDPPVWKTSKNRTDRLLSNPDISSCYGHSWTEDLAQVRGVRYVIVAWRLLYGTACCQAHGHAHLPPFDWASAACRRTDYRPRLPDRVDRRAP